MAILACKQFSKKIKLDGKGQQPSQAENAFTQFSLFCELLEVISEMKLIVGTVEVAPNDYNHLPSVSESVNFKEILDLC